MCIRDSGHIDWPEDIIFDGVLGAAAPRAFPQDLLKPLKDGGKVIFPVGDDKSQTLKVVIKNNEFTGEVDGVPCFREGKVAKVEDWVKTNGYDLSEATFYSDSFNDLPLLEKVKTAIVVDGDNKLIKQAKSNEWECISFR